MDSERKALMKTGTMCRGTALGIFCGALLLVPSVAVVAVTSEGPVESETAVAFTKKVMVLGVPVYATNTTRDEKLLHAAGVLAQFLDNDEDGKPDNPEVHQAILDTGGAIIMTRTEGEGRHIPRDKRPRGQGLYDEETFPGARERGVFDVSLEEIWHMVSDNGLGVAYPDVFGKVPGTEVTNAMDRARGGRFEWPPKEYPKDAWYTYDDETCDYDCQASEYIYWTFTSLIGAQDLPGRLERIDNEWRFNTREKLKEGDPAIFEILSRPEYRLPTVVPDGKYTGEELSIEPYRHQ
jgi:hypothetical protein